jgi:hypothetical protein
MATRKTTSKTSFKKKKSTSTSSKSVKTKNVNKRKQIKKTNKNSILVAAALLVIAVIVAFVFIFIGSDSDTPKISITTDNKEIRTGQTFRVKVYADSKSTPVNVAQFKLEYPGDSMKFNQVTPESDYLVDAITTSDDNSLEITRGNIENLSGEQLVAEIEFEALKSGIVNLILSQPDTLLIDPVLVSNILTEDSFNNLTMEIN